MSSTALRLGVLAFAVAAAAGCTMVTGFGDFVIEGDGDVDSDVDGDTDADGDADADADTDTIVEPDVGPPPLRSCLEGLECARDCGPEDHCVIECADRLCPRAAETLIPMWGCVLDECGGPCIHGEGDCIVCLGNRCGDQLLACESLHCDESTPGG